MGKFKIFISGLIAASAVVACGGGGSGGGLTGAGVGTPGSIETVTLSFPVSTAIVNNLNGTYQRKGSVTVRNAQGLPVAEGTKISLRVADTLIAEGSTAAGNSATGNTISFSSVTDANGGAVASLTTHTINRPGVAGGINRGILANDLVITTTGGDSSDAVRTVASAPTLAPSDLLT